MSSLSGPSLGVTRAVHPSSHGKHRAYRPATPRVSIVVPAKNEAANLREVLPYLAKFHQVIVVVCADDNESDEAARTTLPTAQVVHQTRTGKGNALACGFDRVTGDIVVTFDADGSADPHEIPNFIHALTEGADLAKGSRFCTGGGSQDITMFRAVGNYGLNLLASILTKTRFTDLCYGFNAFWTDQLPLLELPDTSPGTSRLGDGFEIEAMIISRFAISRAAVIAEVPSYEHRRYHGDTKLKTIRDGFRVLRTVVLDTMRARHFRAAAAVRGHEAGSARPDWMHGTVLQFPTRQHPSDSMADEGLA